MLFVTFVTHLSLVCLALIYFQDKPGIDFQAIEAASVKNQVQSTGKKLNLDPDQIRKNQTFSCSCIILKNKIKNYATNEKPVWTTIDAYTISS